MFTEVERIKTLRRTDGQRVIPSELNRLRMAVSDTNKIISETNVEFDKVRLRLGSKH